MRTVVVIPTYNEKKNIGRLIPRVFEAMRGHPDAHVLVMDDSSPDGTGDAVKAIQTQYKNLHLKTGTKQGRGAADLRGFKSALNILHADVIVQMDADFSHDPRALPRLIQRVEAGHDVAIGSRYVPGGRIPDWPLFRRLTSWGANTLSRLIAGLSSVKDCTFEKSSESVGWKT